MSEVPPAVAKPRLGRLDALAFGWSIYYVLFFFVGQNVLYRDAVIWLCGPLLVAGSFLGLVATKDGLKASLPLILFTAFVVWTMVGAGLAVDTDAFLYHLRRISQNLLMFGCIVLVLRRTGQLTPFLLAMLLTGILNGIVGGDVDEVAVMTSEHVQAQGLTENPNALAFLALLGILGGLGLLRSFRSWIARGAIALAMAYVLSVAVAAASRGAFISLAIALTLWPVLCYRKRLFRTPARLFAIAATGVLIAIGTNYILENTYLGERINRTAELEGGEEMRSALAREALSVFADAPFTGVGIGQFPFVSQYGKEPHGDYAELLSTTGFIGFGLFVAIYITGLWRLQRVRSLISDDEVLCNQVDFAQLIIIVLMSAGFYRPNFLIVECIFVLGIAHGVAEHARAVIAEKVAVDGGAL